MVKGAILVFFSKRLSSLDMPVKGATMGARKSQQVPLQLPFTSP